ncbi:hypothetical protein BMY_0965 [Wohlfahrtiimonas chitiniclastica]|nr:hypothetical protein BMY_0965 [Wohlfahrtiimonas chitiniclastica]
MFFHVQSSMLSMNEMLLLLPIVVLKPHHYRKYGAVCVL